MIRYSLPNDPNFKISITPESETYTFEIRCIRGLMYAIINNVQNERIAGPVRICNNQWLMVCEARKPRGAGNFKIIDKWGEYPMFSSFPTSCELQYFSAEEIKEGAAY